MNPTVLALPCAFMISLLVAKTGLIALQLPVDPVWLTGAVLLCVFLLYKRTLVELGLITILAVLAEVHSLSSQTPSVSPDILLSVLVAIILLPLALNVMGLSSPRVKFGPRLKYH